MELLAAVDDTGGGRSWGADNPHPDTILLYHLTTTTVSLLLTTLEENSPSYQTIHSLQIGVVTLIFSVPFTPHPSMSPAYLHHSQQD